MKKWLKILGALLLLLVLFVGAVFWLTSGAVRTTEGFFASMSEGDWPAARGYLSAEFLASAPEDEIRAFFVDAGADVYGSSSWPGRFVSTEGATLKGRIETVDGETVALNIDLVRREDGWKIHHIERLSPALGGPDTNPLMPNLEQAQALVTETTLAFARGLQAGDLGPFHAATAPEFRNQISLARFNQLFAAFLQHRPDLTGVASVEPILTQAPSLSEDGVLQLVGRFPLRPSPVEFDYQFLSRRAGWQLLGLNVTLPPASDAEP